MSNALILTIVTMIGIMVIHYGIWFAFVDEESSVTITGNDGEPISPDTMEKIKDAYVNHKPMAYVLTILIVVLIIVTFPINLVKNIWKFLTK